MSANDDQARKALVDSCSDALDETILSGVAGSESSAERAAVFARVFAEAAAAEVYMELERGGW